MSGKGILIVWAMTATGVLLAPACSMQKRYARADAKKQQEIDAMRLQKEAEQLAEYESALQAHYDQQSPEVRKQMKRNYRKAERINANKQEYWIIRFYKTLFPEKIKTKKKRVRK